MEALVDPAGETIWAKPGRAFVAIDGGRVDMAVPRLHRLHDGLCANIPVWGLECSEPRRRDLISAVEFHLMLLCLFPANIPHFCHTDARIGHGVY